MIDLVYQFGHIILIACCAALAIAVGLAILTIAAALHEMNELERGEDEQVREGKSPLPTGRDME